MQIKEVGLCRMLSKERLSPSAGHSLLTSRPLQDAQPPLGATPGLCGLPWVHLRVLPKEGTDSLTKSQILGSPFLPGRFSCAATPLAPPPAPRIWASVPRQFNQNLHFGSVIYS